MSSKHSQQNLLSQNQLNHNGIKINSLVLQYSTNEEAKLFLQKIKQQRRFSLQPETKSDSNIQYKRYNSNKISDDKQSKFKNMNKWEIDENSNEEIYLTIGYLFICSLIAISIFFSYSCLMNKK